MTEPHVEQAVCAIEVQAGLIPNQPEPEFTKRYFITSAEWHDESKKQSEILAETNGKAAGYATMLMLMPDRLNWVGLDWIWF